MEGTPKLTAPKGPEYNQFGEILVKTVRPVLETTNQLQEEGREWYGTLSTKSQEQFAAMSDKAREVAGWFGEHISSAKDAVIARFEFVYSEQIEHLIKYLGDQAEMAALEHRLTERHTATETAEKEVHSLAATAETLKQSRELLNEMAAAPDMLSTAQADGTAIETEIAAIEMKHTQRSDQFNTLKTERDALADTLLRRYDETLAPFEANLAQLNELNYTQCYELETLSIQEEKILAHLQALEEQQTERYILLERRPTLKPYLTDEVIKALRKSVHDIEMHLGKIREAKTKLQQEQKKTAEQIKKCNAEAEPYRAKKEKIMRIRDGAPESPTASSNNSPETAGTASDIEIWQDYTEAAADKKTPEKPPITKTCQQFLDAWNAFVTDERNKVDTADLQTVIQPNDFIKGRFTFFNASSKLNHYRFKQLLSQHLASKKILKAKCDQTIEKFLAHLTTTN